MTPVAYTAIYKRPITCITTPCKVSLPFDQTFDQGEHPTFIECEAIWDTGAMRSTISVGLAQKLGLILMCDFALTSPNGDTKFSFNIPSSEDVDFLRN